MKVTLKRENSTIHRKEQKLHYNTFNTDFRNGPRGKKEQVWNIKKTKEVFLAKYFTSDSWGIGHCLPVRTSFSVILWMWTQPHSCFFSWFNVPQILHYSPFSTPVVTLNIRRKSIHGIHPCGNLRQSKMKKKEIHPDMRSKKKKSTRWSSMPLTHKGSY